MILYTFIKTLSKLTKVILCLSQALSVLYLTFSALLIICILLLSTIKWYISLHRRAILPKTRKTNFPSQTSSIERVTLNLKANIIISLAIYLKFLLKYLFNTKDVLYMVKKVVGLQITHNKSVMTQKSILTTNFKNTKVDLVMNIICKTI